MTVNPLGLDVARGGVVLPPPKISMLTYLSRFPEKARLELLEALGEGDIDAIQGDWLLNARREQLPPPGDDWRIWLILGGRGFGKTRTGAEYIYRKHRYWGTSRSAMLGPTVGDIRDYQIEGESGVLSITPNDWRPEYISSKKRIEWPNGSITHCYTAEEPERIRGPNLDFAWCDELASWAEHSDEAMEYAWQMLRFCMRIGTPETIITMTPKPRPLLMKLLKRSDIVVTGGSTFENEANLAKEFLQEMKDDFEGTTIGQQELYAQILDLTSGGLWSPKQFKAITVRSEDVPELVRIIIAVDPATTAKEGSDYTAIIVVGLGVDGLAYVLADYTLKASPLGWANKVKWAYEEWRANLIVVEVNQGGDLVVSNLHQVDSMLPIKSLHVYKGKITRAEPIAAKYEQGLVRHVRNLLDLEAQMCMMKPGRIKKSPDRADALVYALTELIGGFKSRAGVWGGARKRSKLER